MTEIKQNLSFKEKAKLEAQNAIKEEKFKEAKEKLLVLYRKQEAAKKVLKNIENEIIDLEMEIEE